MHHSNLSPALKGNSIDSIWLVIAGLVIGAALLTVLGWMDWTPAQADVPHSTTPVVGEALIEAVKEGGLRLGN